MIDESVRDDECGHPTNISGSENPDKTIHDSKTGCWFQCELARREFEMLKGVITLCRAKICVVQDGYEVRDVSV